MWLGVLVALGLVAAAVLAVNSGGSGSNGGSSDGGGSAVEVTADDRVLGDPSAPVTIVEYGDFKCPLCARFAATTEPELRRRYIDNGQVRLVWRDFAVIDGESPLATEAGRCAHAQGRFWEFHDALYSFIWDNYYSQGTNVEGQSAYRGQLDELARQAGVDVEAFRACLDADTYTEAVARDRQQGQQQGVRGTPTFFVNGQRVVGAQPFDVFAQLIERELPGS